jgi:hypothetical protein
VSQSSRPAHWWEIPREQQREGRQGRLAHARGSLVGIDCPKCGAAPVVYNGNYFCDNWTFPFSSADGECDWALAHPATTKRDQAICDLLGIDYS